MLKCDALNNKTIKRILIVWL